MKAFFTALLIVLGSSVMAHAQGVREIEIRAEKAEDVDHGKEEGRWMPERIEVVQGETVRFVFRHELEGRFEFHGVEIIPLQIKLRVHRHKPVKVERQIPLTLKPGEYDIECRFHPRHVPAKLIVKEKAP